MLVHLLYQPVEGEHGGVCKTPTTGRAEVPALQNGSLGADPEVLEALAVPGEAPLVAGLVGHPRNLQKSQNRGGRDTCLEPWVAVIS